MERNISSLTFLVISFCLSGGFEALRVVFRYQLLYTNDPHHAGDTITDHIRQGTGFTHEAINTEN